MDCTSRIWYAAWGLVRTKCPFENTRKLKKNAKNEKSLWKLFNLVNHDLIYCFKKDIFTKLFVGDNAFVDFVLMFSLLNNISLRPSSHFSMNQMLNGSILVRFTAGCSNWLRHYYETGKKNQILTLKQAWHLCETIGRRVFQKRDTLAYNKCWIKIVSMTNGKLNFCTKFNMFFAIHIFFFQMGIQIFKIYFLNTSIHIWIMLDQCFLMYFFNATNYKVARNYIYPVVSVDVRGLFTFSSCFCERIERCIR